MRVKKELTLTKKKIFEQLESTLAHKEQMKERELEQSHANTLAWTKHW
jgi:hypothetical protein